MTFPTAPQKAFSFSSGLMGWKHDVIGAHPWNKLRVIQRIDEFNFTEGEEKLGFQLSGCRGGQRSISHVWRRQWREIEQCKKNCLHLSDKKRVDIKYIRKNYSAIASLRILVTSSFGRKCTVKEVNILFAHISFQANMDGDEGELWRFEKFLFSFCETRITIVL